MLRILFFLAGVMIMVSATITGAGAQENQPSVTRLANGMQVLIQQDTRFPLVSLRLFVRAGSAHETDAQAGISHLLEHMVFKGTAKRGPGEVADTIEKAGGYLNAATSFDYTVYIIDVPADKLTLGLDVLEDMVFGVRIDPEELEREKKVVLAELERGEDDPGNRRFKKLQPQLWPETGYARPIIGTRKTISSFTPDDITAYINQYYQPQSMLAVVVGNVDPQKTLAQVTSLFDKRENTRPVTPPPAAPVASHTAPRITVEKGPWNKVYASIAFPIPSLHAEAMVGLDLLGHLLGGDETSLLYRKFKYDKGLVDSIAAYAMQQDRVGVFMISATLDEKNLPAFWKDLMHLLARPRLWKFTEQELKRARLNTEDALFSSKETLSGLASKLGYFQFFHHSTTAEENFLYAVNNTELKEIYALANSYLQGNNLAAALLLPEPDSPNGKTTDTDTEKILAKAVQQAFIDQEKAAIATATVTSKTGKARTIDLGGGRTLELIADATLPYTAITLAMAGGDSLLSAQEQGLAALTARALEKGTQKHTALQFNAFLADRAASLDASASRDMFLVSSRFPVRFTADMLPLIQDMLTRPAFARKELGRAQKEQIAAIARREDQPLGLAFRNLFPFLVSGAGYGYLHQGTPDAIMQYSKKDIRRYWNRQKRQPWVMSVCGVFDEKAIEELARSLATQFTNKDPADAFEFLEPDWNSTRTLQLKLQDRNQAHIVLSFPVAGLHHEDSPGLDVLRSTLAGQGGLLFGDLRDKQSLGYSVTAFLWQAPAFGFLSFYIGTSPDKTQQALDGFEKTIHNLHAGILKQKDINRATALLEGDYYRDHQSLSARSSEAAGLTLRGFPLDYNKKHLEKAKKITPRDLQDLAKKYLLREKAYTLRVEP